MKKDHVTCAVYVCVYVCVVQGIYTLVHLLQVLYQLSVVWLLRDLSILSKK